MSSSLPERADMPEPRQTSSDFLVRWIFATTLGFVLAAAIASIAEAFILDNSALFPATASPRVSGDQSLPLGLVLGAVLAVVAQALLVLRRERMGRAWIVVSAPGMVISLVAVWILADRPVDPLKSNTLAPIIALALVAALSLSVSQWWLLRRRVSRAWVWVITSMAGTGLSLPIGWIGGLVIGSTLAMIMTALTNAHIGGLVGGATIVVAAGLVQGVVGGIVLAWLLLSRPGPTPAEKERGLQLFGQPLYGVLSVALFFVSVLVVALLAVSSPSMMARDLSLNAQKAIAAVLVFPPALLGMVMGALAVRASDANRETGKSSMMMVWGAAGLFLNTGCLFFETCLMLFSG